MMADQTFVSYKVKGRLKSGQRIDWYVLSPSRCLDQVDVPWWNFLREKGFFEGEWIICQRYSSVADLYSANEPDRQSRQTGQAERHAVLRSLPSVLSADREAFSKGSAEDF